MHTKLKRAIARFRKEEKGASLIEYSILIGLISAAVITIIVSVGAWVTGEWTALQTAIGSGPPPPPPPPPPP